MAKVTTIEKCERIELFKVEVDGAVAYATESHIVDRGSRMIEVNCAHGLLVCGIYNMDKFNAGSIPAAMFTPVKDLSAVLAAKPAFLSEAAAAKGATMEMTGEEILKLFS